MTSSLGRAETVIPVDPAAKQPKKKPHQRCLRAWFVGAVPFAHLLRHVGTDDRVHLSLNTPSMSFAVASAAEADAAVMKLVMADPPAPPDGMDPTAFDGKRVIFKVTAIDVQVTSDDAEHPFSPDLMLK